MNTFIVLCLERIIYQCDADAFCAFWTKVIRADVVRSVMPVTLAIALRGSIACQMTRKAKFEMVSPLAEYAYEEPL